MSNNANSLTFSSPSPSQRTRTTPQSSLAELTVALTPHSEKIQERILDQRQREESNSFALRQALREIKAKSCDKALDTLRNVSGDVVSCLRLSVSDTPSMDANRDIAQAEEIDGVPQDCPAESKAPALLATQVAAAAPSGVPQVASGAAGHEYAKMPAEPNSSPDFKAATGIYCSSPAFNFAALKAEKGPSDAAAAEPKPGFGPTAFNFAAPEAGKGPTDAAAADPKPGFGPNGEGFSNLFGSEQQLAGAKASANSFFNSSSGRNNNGRSSKRRLPPEEEEEEEGDDGTVAASEKDALGTVAKRFRFG